MILIINRVAFAALLDAARSDSVAGGDEEFSESLMKYLRAYSEGAELPIPEGLKPPTSGELWDALRLRIERSRRAALAQWLEREMLDFAFEPHVTFPPQFLQEQAAQLFRHGFPAQTIPLLIRGFVAAAEGIRDQKALARLCRAACFVLHGGDPLEEPEAPPPADEDDEDEEDEDEH